MTAPWTGTPRNGSPERDRGSELEDVYLRELIRLQLLVSAAGLAAFAGVVGALPLALLVAPHLIGFQVARIPLWLFLLGPPPFVLFLVIGWLYRRRADALDAEYVELLRRR